jgi:hypothetical protein
MYVYRGFCGTSGPHPHGTLKIKVPPHCIIFVVIYEIQREVPFYELLRSNLSQWMLPSSGIYRHITHMLTDVSEKRITSIFRIKISRARNQPVACGKPCRFRPVQKTEIRWPLSLANVSSYHTSRMRRTSRRNPGTVWMSESLSVLSKRLPLPHFYHCPRSHFLFNFACPHLLPILQVSKCEAFEHLIKLYSISDLYDTWQSSILRSIQGLVSMLHISGPGGRIVRVLSAYAFVILL